MGSDVADRVNAVLDKVKLAGVCPDEAKEVRNALLAYDQALADVDANAWTEGGGLFGMGTGVVLIIACGGPQAGTPACWGTALATFIGGSLASGAGMRGMIAAQKSERMTMAGLEDALDALAKCIDRQFPP